MLENQFIKIDVYRNTLNDNGMPLPVFLGIKINAIFIKGSTSAITVYTKDPQRTRTFQIEPTESEYRIIQLSTILLHLLDEEEFVLGFDIGGYSQKLIKYSSPSLYGYEFIEYRCDEDAFGFPFSLVKNDILNSLCFCVPIRLHSPQNVQDDKTYVKANGEVVTLYAKYYKEWDGETEYLSAEMHDKIVAALSCDMVYIGYKRVTKSDKYQVDWEKYDLDCDGVTKLARATFKVRENITQRNSNF